MSKTGTWMCCCYSGKCSDVELQARLRWRWLDDNIASLLDTYTTAAAAATSSARPERAAPGDHSVNARQSCASHPVFQRRSTQRSDRWFHQTERITGCRWHLQAGVNVRRRYQHCQTVASWQGVREHLPLP